MCARRMARRSGACEETCAGGATTPQPSIVRLILHAAGSSLSRTCARRGTGKTTLSQVQTDARTHTPRTKNRHLLFQRSGAKPSHAAGGADQAHEFGFFC